MRPPLSDDRAAQEPHQVPREQVLFGEDIRYFFYITTRTDLTPPSRACANDRCDQENVIEQLKNASTPYACRSTTCQQLAYMSSPHSPGTSSPVATMLHRKSDRANTSPWSSAASPPPSSSCPPSWPATPAAPRSASSLPAQPRRFFSACAPSNAPPTLTPTSPQHRQPAPTHDRRSSYPTPKPHPFKINSLPARARPISHAATNHAHPKPDLAPRYRQAEHAYFRHVPRSGVPRPVPRTRSR